MLPKPSVACAIRSMPAPAAAARPRRDGLPAVVVELHGDGVDDRVARLDARDRRLQQLLRRPLAPRDQRGEPQPVVALILGESAHGTLLCRGHSTVESARARMGWHLPFDRTERCLTRGQHALARRDFPAAEALLREALARDPDYAHGHMYLAHALAEQERLAEAEAALARAMALAPGIFVFPLHLGIVRLDAGDTGGARLALESAARLAPDNPPLAGYLDLVAWEQGDYTRLVGLGRSARELPESFRARLLLRLAAARLATRGPKTAIALLEPSPEPPVGIS